MKPKHISICKRLERYITIRFQENANRKVVDLKIKGFQKLLRKENKSQPLQLKTHSNKNSRKEIINSNKSSFQ